MPRLPGQQRMHTDECFWLILLAFYATSMFNRGGYVLVLLLAMYLVLHIHHIRISLLTLSLMLFSFFYFCFYSMYYSPGVTETFNYLIAPWAAFLFGEIFTRRSGSRNGSHYVIAVLALGFFAHGFLNLIAYLAHAGGTGGRIAYDFWRQEWISVTANGLYYSMGLGLAFGILFSGFGKGTKLMALAIIGVAGVNATLLGHRTSLYIIVLLMLFNAVRMLLRSDMPNWKKIRWMICIVFVLLLFVIAYGANLAGMRSWIQSTSLYQRMTNKNAVNSTERTTIWLSFFKEAPFHPFGGEAFPLAGGQSWVHNLWLDVYYKVGVLPFVFLAAATVMIASQFISLRRVCRKNGNGRLLEVVTNLYLAALLSCAVEPVIDANPYMLISFFMIAGCVSGILQPEQEGAQ